MSTDHILSIEPLRFPWQTLDPFIFCVHHDDRYPKANEAMGPDASLDGRSIGQDFAGVDGWNMYHGDVVPGFPHHPHRGFETVTIVRSGLIDHSDSLGAAARYGNGDVQWLTAGKGVNHAEMFPLLDRDNPNRLELFQIWLNLAKADKMTEPHFAMFWSDAVPVHSARDEVGRATEVTVIAGPLADAAPPPPPPGSWAARPASDVRIWTIRMEPNARWTLPTASEGSNAMLYLFRGDSIIINGHMIPVESAVRLNPATPIDIVNGPEASELLLLGGRPIDEPVAQHGPFVMNTRAEIVEAFEEYQRTQFGGWPWPEDAPVHPREEGRFAKHADGRVERPLGEGSGE